MKEYFDGQIKDYVLHASSPAWEVKEVEPQSDYTLLLTFANGERRRYDAQPLLGKAIYSPLRNIALFMRAKVAGDSVAWNDDLDIAPEHLYECSVPEPN